jgi:hypothetical protein
MMLIRDLKFTKKTRDNSHQNAANKMNLFASLSPSGRVTTSAYPAGRIPHADAPGMVRRLAAQ